MPRFVQNLLWPFERISAIAYNLPLIFASTCAISFLTTAYLGCSYAGLSGWYILQTNSIPVVETTSGYFNIVPDTVSFSLRVGYPGTCVSLDAETWFCGHRGGPIFDIINHTPGKQELQHVQVFIADFIENRAPWWIVVIEFAVWTPLLIQIVIAVLLWRHYTSTNTPERTRNGVVYKEPYTCPRPTLFVNLFVIFLTLALFIFFALTVQQVAAQEAVTRLAEMKFTSAYFTTASVGASSVLFLWCAVGSMTLLALLVAVWPFCWRVRYHYESGRYFGRQTQTLHREDHELREVPAAPGRDAAALARASTDVNLGDEVL